MLYSSGTTGRPKGVSVDLGAGPLETTASSVTLLLGGLFECTSDDVYLSPAPMYHAAPLRFVMAANAIGSTAVLIDHFDAEEFLAIVERYRVTTVQVVPTMFVRLLKLPSRRPRPLRRLVTALRHPCCGAVSGARQGADDRLVRTDHPRVLRGHRGQRVRATATRRTGWPTRAPSASRSSARSTCATTSSASYPSARPARSGSKAPGRSSTTTTRRRPRRRAARRVGRRSAMSATSTPTGSSSSPIASRT